MKAKGITLKTARKRPGTISRAKVRKVVAAVYAGSFTRSSGTGKFTEVFVTNDSPSSKLQSKGN